MLEKKKNRAPPSPLKFKLVPYLEKALYDILFLQKHLIDLNPQCYN